MSQASNPRQITFAILGAGPCGLGAAYRLHELGESNWELFEQHDYAGGLATSFQDEKGFTWDIGGHVVHSHYRYFDKVFETALGKEALKHQRESWVWLYNQFIPYPFQNNLRYLPKQALWESVIGLLELKANHQKAARALTKKSSFQDWILAHFGRGIAEHFLFPYNRKVWAYPLQKMNSVWVGDRVAEIDLRRALKNILLGEDDVAWGPNHVFYFPAKGGTGALWKKIAARLPAEKLRFNQKVVALDAAKHLLTLASGETVQYQYLITTLPLTEILIHTHFPAKRAAVLSASALAQTKKALFASTVHVIGIGLTGKPKPELTTKCWLYYPDANLPFFRVTVFSNYAPSNVPKPGKQWSLMCEVSESPLLPRFLTADGQTDEPKLIQAVITGLIEAELIQESDKIVSTWTHTAKLGYPTPTLAREKTLHPTLKALEQFQIYSRGRFGAWKYEVSNMDHSFMQGVEVIDRLVSHQPETTVWHPAKINGS